MGDKKGEDTTTSSETTFESPYDETDKQKRIFKIIVIGDSNVGKTCLTFRFCGGKFPEKTEATIGVDFREKTIDVDGESLKLQLWDTAGQERFRKSMVQHYYRNVHAVVFVYDMTKLSTFESLPTWIDECDRHSLAPDIPRVLVGNKCDMIDKILITTGMAQKFADANNMPLFETSALDSDESDNIKSIFMTLAHKLKMHRPMMPLSTPATDAYKTRIVRMGDKPHYEFERDSDGPCPC